VSCDPMPRLRDCKTCWWSNSKARFSH